MRCRALGLVLLPTMIGFAASSLAAADAIDGLIRDEMSRRRIPGLAFAALRDGEVLTMRSYGIANLETGSPVTKSSVFELASVTKPFTAMAILLLVEEGKVRLEDPITNYIGPAPAEWGSITVRHLLTHTAGFEELGEAGCDGIPLLDVTTERQLDTIRKLPLLFPPGTRAQYSDPGYFLLGMVIEKASQMGYAQFMDVRIFRPLGMASTSVLDQSRIIEGRVSPYSLRGEELVRGRRDWQHELPSFFGILSTIEDLAKWERALSRPTLLPSGALEMMWSPARLDDGRTVFIYGQPYGYGWMLGDYRGRRVVEHGGYSGTHVMRLPDDGLTVIVLTNLDNGSGNMPPLTARGIAGLLEPDLLPPHLMAPGPDPDTLTTAAIRGFLQAFGEEAALSRMTEAHRSFFLEQPEEVRTGMARLFRGLGGLEYLGRDNLAGAAILRLDVPVARIAYYRGESARGRRYFSFWLTDDGKIADMRNYPY